MPIARLANKNGYLVNKFENVRGVPVQFGENGTSLNMSGGRWRWGAEALYKEEPELGPCTGFFLSPMDRMTDYRTDTTENITFTTPLAEGNYRILPQPMTR